MSRVHHRLLSVILLLLVAGCGGGGGIGRPALNLVLVGLPDLGDGHGYYALWAVVSGAPVSLGAFIIDGSTSPATVLTSDGTRPLGTVDGASFGPASTALGNAFPQLQYATALFVTIEPEGGSAGKPSGNVVLTGPFVGQSVVLTAGPALTTGDLSLAGGVARIETPTAGPDGGASGVWFETGGGPGLVLPPPASGWVYEGWVSDGTQTLSTGRFTDPGSFDFDAQATPTRGSSGIGFLTPGEDFLVPVIGGSTPVLDLASGNWLACVTVEPFPDNSTARSQLVILESVIPQGAVDADGMAVIDIGLGLALATLPRMSVTVQPQAAMFSGIGPRDAGFPRGGHFACWATVGGVPALCGRFYVDAATGAVRSLDGATVFGMRTAFTLDAANTGLGPAFPDLSLAADLFMTYEPQGSQNFPTAGTPSVHVFLAGALANNASELTVAGLSDSGGPGLTDFSGAGGAFSLGTPTDDAPGAPVNDGMGIWFRYLAAGEPALVLPVLPPGWRYEGWVVNTVTSQTVSTGKFLVADTADFDAMTWPGRGAVNTGYPVPGQDFVTANAGVAVSPQDLTLGWTAFITLEPTPPNRPGPSFLRILEVALPPTTQVPVTFQNLLNSGAVSLPSGSASYIQAVN